MQTLGLALAPGQGNPRAPCDTYMNLGVGIGGKQFSINPFDLLSGRENGSISCMLDIGPNDPPTGKGYSAYTDQRNPYLPLRAEQLSSSYNFGVPFRESNQLFGAAL